MYDVIIIGAGPGGIFSAYELMKQDENLKIAVFDAGHSLEQRHCPIDGEKVKSCISCKTCAIMNGFGGAGAFSDGKYNITNDFGGTLYEYIGRQKALELMKYVDTINMSHGGEGTKMYSTAGTDLKKVCLQNKLKLLDASVRHLGTDVNYVVLKNLYDEMKEHMDFFFDTPVEKIQVKRTVTQFRQKMQNMRAENVSCRLDEAEASGWRMSVRIWKFLPNPTVWISVCG